MGVNNLGHVVLRVRDADLSAEWYRTVLGLHETARFGNQMVFLAAGDVSSHELALQTLGPDAPPPEQTRIGLYHVGWQMASLEELKQFREHIRGLDVEIAGIGDHGISIGVYMLDPDGNELEVFYELPRAEWPADRSSPFEGHFPEPVEL